MCAVSLHPQAWNSLALFGILDSVFHTECGMPWGIPPQATNFPSQALLFCIAFPPQMCPTASYSSSTTVTLY